MPNRRGENDPLDRLRKNRERAQSERSEGDSGNTGDNTNDNTSNTGSNTDAPAPHAPGGYLTATIDKDRWHKLQVWLPPDLAERLDELSRDFGGSKSRTLAYLVDQFTQ